MYILNVVGARPNLVKMAPIVHRMMQTDGIIEQRLLHTGQHYDEAMSKVFFDELEIPTPDVYLGIGSGSHATQTAAVMVAFEKEILRRRPDMVLVVGDVNSTLACALTAAKLHVPVAHVEAGLRSRDRRMPEEINRILTDSVSDLLFTTSRLAGRNLIAEGIPSKRVYFVGNVMIDTLEKHRLQAEKLRTPHQLGLIEHRYVLLTLHRPSNVDVPETLDGITRALAEIQTRLPIVFPLHPRTAQRLDDFGLRSMLDKLPCLTVVPPQGYLSFLDLMMHARVVLTDSGGIQEETTALGIPCLTLRENTERPETVSEGTNRLVNSTPSDMVDAVDNILQQSTVSKQRPELWDGHASERIIQMLLDHPLYDA